MIKNIVIVMLLFILAIPVIGDSPKVKSWTECKEGWKVSITTVETNYVTTVSTFQFYEPGKIGPHPIECDINEK